MNLTQDNNLVVTAVLLQGVLGVFSDPTLLLSLLIFGDNNNYPPVYYFCG